MSVRAACRLEPADHVTHRQGFTVFSIPVGVVYRPNEAKVRNLKTKDYLGKARLVAASDRSNAFTGFAGSEIKNVSPVYLRLSSGSCSDCGY